MILTEKSADFKVAKLQAQGLDIEWDGWKLINYIPHDGAYMKVGGAFRNGQWCVKKTYELDSSGKWNLPGIYFK